MNSLFDHQMVFVTGKGGVGKTTVAVALAAEAAAAGKRTILCEVGDQRRAAQLLGVEAGAHGDETPLADGLWGMSISPQRALEEWLARQLGSRSLTQVLARSGGFQYFVAAAPGAKELVTMTKVWELTQDERWDKRAARRYDLVVVDAPASGHGLAMLAAPGTFASVARVGPIASQATRVREFLEDARRSAYLAVALPAELPVSETLELEHKLAHELGRPLAVVVANQVLPRRFTRAEVERVGGVASSWSVARQSAAASRDVVGAVEGVGAGARAGRTGARTDRAGARAAGVGARAARSHVARVTEQQSQLRRLRRGLRAPVTTLPFVVSEHLAPDDVGHLGAALSRGVA